MLKDKIIKNFEIMKDRNQREYIPFDFKGELNVRAWRDGKLIYHDGGDNTITLWAKQMVMHLLTGDVFTQLGETGKTMVKSDVSTHINTEGAGLNGDGMIISQEQFWWDYAIFTQGFWSKANDLFVSKDMTGNIYPLFPTKMLFGTGKEYATWEEITNPLEVDFLTQEGYSVANFITNINDVTNNYYSGTVDVNGTKQKYGSGPIVKSRTVNDYVRTRIEGSPQNNEYGVCGAIKNGTFSTEATGVVDGKIALSESGEPSLVPEYSGIGKPCFIYCRKENYWDDAAGDVFLSNEGGGYINKITFTVNMPDQTEQSGSLNKFYPYNGFTLKEVGLFNDGLLSINNGITGAGTYNYDNMMCGMMMAKRYIAPLVKDAGISISAQWTLFL
jgi:hypothetical protein